MICLPARVPDCHPGRDVLADSRGSRPRLPELLTAFAPHKACPPLWVAPATFNPATVAAVLHCQSTRI